MLTRRGFVGATAAGGLALATGAGCGAGPVDGRAGGGRRVIVIGAGLAGIGAARELRRAGITPVVLEARGRIGGRVHTVDQLGAPLDLGAAWIHDSRGNPLTAFARRAGLVTVPTGYDRVALRRPGGVPIPAAAVAAAGDALQEIDEALYAAAEEAPWSTPLAGPLRRARAAAGLSGAPLEALDWLLGNALELDLGAGADELSLAGYAEGETYRGGADLLLRRGAGALVAEMAGDLDVRRSTPVREVRRRAGSVTVVTADGASIRADGCVVTVPLGVLQAGAVRFDPPLPAAARRAIRRLGFGLLDKVLLRYDRAWWPGDVATVGTVGAPVAATPSAFPVTALTGLPILVAFTGGRRARELERLTDAEVVAAVTGGLAVGFGDVARRPREALVTRWAADRYARGSYSFLAPGARTEDRVALGRPAGRVVLAGEHTSPDRPATMDGAWRAGRRAGRLLARRIAAGG